MMREGYIVSHVKRGVLGQPVQTTHEHQGGALITISNHLLHELKLVDANGKIPPKITNLTPHILILLEENFIQDSTKYLLIKNPLYYIYPYLRKTHNLLDLFYRRCILALCVWQLAEYNEATMPYWGDIKAIIKIRSWFKKKDV